jgi:hypothetical protein
VKRRRHRGIPTRQGETLTLVRVRGVKGQWRVDAEDAHEVPTRISWTHDERGRPVDDDGPIGQFGIVGIGAQKLMAGDTVNEMHRLFDLWELESVTRRPSRCEPQDAFERSCCWWLRELV